MKSDRVDHALARTFALCVAAVVAFAIIVVALSIGDRASHVGRQNLERQYDRCLRTYGYGSPAFTTCLK